MIKKQQKKYNKMKKLNQLLNEIGFGSRMGKNVDDESKAEFQNFGEYVGSLYQKFQTKDLSSEPAIAQKIRDFVSVEDDESELVSKIKDLEYLIDQLPNKPKPKGKIGFKESMKRYSYRYDEANMPINSPRDLIDSDILDIPDGDVGEIKRAAAKLGIDPQNKYESELRDEIDDLLTSPMSTYEEYELVKKYFGDYADELINQYGLKIDEMTDDEFEKAKEADRLEKHPERDKIKKIQQLIKKQIKELWLKK
jgi:hypothetical protein